MKKLDIDLLDVLFELPDRDITVWSFFVKARMMLCKCSITVAEISQGHEHLTMYCKQFKIRYGTNNCVPNMHLGTTFKGVDKRFWFGLRFLVFFIRTI